MFRFGLTTACLLLLAHGRPATGQEWTRFRGPNGSGVSPATTVPVRFGDKDFNWKVRLPGVGHSSPVLWGERIFLTSAEEATGRRLVVCLRATDGQRLWVHDLGGQRHGKHDDNSFASATPVVDEGRVYTCWGSPREFLVVALGHDGKEAWRVDLGPFNSGHGFGASPILFQDRLIVPNDQNGASALVALDRVSGKVCWKVPRKSKASFTTPCVYHPKNGPAELLFTNYEHGVTSLDPDSGAVRWESDVFDKRHVECAIASPVVAGDVALAGCGWMGVRQEVVALRLKPGGQAREVYRVARSAPLCPTPLAVGDLLFLWGDDGIVTCADLHTGEVHWRESVPGSYYSSPICVGGRVYNISREGDAVVLAAAKRYELLARNRLGEGSHSTPAVADGRLYVRTFTRLVSLGGK